MLGYIYKRWSKALFVSYLGLQLLFAQSSVPKAVTLLDITNRPKAFDGQLVRVRASALIGWEGDNFLVEAPTGAKWRANRAPYGTQVWFQCKPDNACKAIEAFRVRTTSGDFIGYFHFVPYRNPNDLVMFDPGPYQLEVIRISDIRMPDLPVDSWFSEFLGSK